MSADPKRVQCPDCPDGQVWDRNGPTREACPTCGGNAFVWAGQDADREMLGSDADFFDGEIGNK